MKSSGTYNASSILVQLMLVLKLDEIRSGDLPNLSYDNLEDYVTNELWLNHVPLYLSSAARDIGNIHSSDIVRYLSEEAAYKGKKEHLTDFSDLLGGN